MADKLSGEHYAMKIFTGILFAATLWGQAITGVPPIFVTHGPTGAATISTQQPSPFALRLENSTEPPGSPWLTSITSPPAPTLATGAAGLLNGTYFYAVKCVLPYGGRSDFSPLSSSISVTNAHVTVTLGTCPGPTPLQNGASAIAIYRTAAGVGGSYPNLRLVQIIPNNTSTYSDNTPDSGLGAGDSDLNSAGGCLLVNSITDFCSWQKTTGAFSTVVGLGGLAYGQGVWLGNWPNSDPTYMGALFVAAGPPTNVNSSTATTGGTLPASTTYWYLPCTEDTNGHDTCGAEVSRATGSSTATNTITITWTISSGSTVPTNYKIYKGPCAGCEVNSQLVISNGATVTDTGSNFATSASPNRVIPAGKIAEEGSDLIITDRLRTMYGTRQSGFSSADMPTIASAATIAPVTSTILVTGTTPINTITPQTGCTTSIVVCYLTILWDHSAAASLTASGNISSAIQGQVDRTTTLLYFPSNSKWYASASGLDGVAVTFTPGTGVTSVTCIQPDGSTATTCNLGSGSLQIVGGTATTGTVATMNYTVGTAPRTCSISMNGGATFLGLGHGVPGTTSMTFTSAVSVLGVTLNADYRCSP